jgi:hypothetical protein
MARITKIANDERNQVLYGAIETVPGVAPASGYQKINGTIDFPLGPPPLSDTADVTGTYMSDDTPARGNRIPSGNFSAPASFERLPWWARLAIESGDAPASGSGPDYTYIQEPNLTADDVDTAAFKMGVVGNGFQVAGFRATEFNLATDVDNASGFWEISGTANASSVDELPGSFEGVATGGTATTLVMTGAGWTVNYWEGAFVFNEFGSGTGDVRQVVSNTADTLTVSTAWDRTPLSGDTFRIAGMFPAGVVSTAEEKIPNAGTKLWILDVGVAPSATNFIRNRVISANVNIGMNLDPKTFLENEAGTTSGIFGRGALQVTGSVRMEFDRYDELSAMKAMREMLIRIEQTGTELDTGLPKMARVEVTRAVWNEQTRDQRNNNLTQTLSFRGYLNTPPYRITTRNGLAAL